MTIFLRSTYNIFFELQALVIAMSALATVATTTSSSPDGTTVPKPKHPQPQPQHQPGSLSPIKAVDIKPSNEKEAMKTEAPYGAWPSPITAKLITQSGVKMGGISVSDAGVLHWLEGRPVTTPPIYRLFENH